MTALAILKSAIGYGDKSERRGTTSFKKKMPRGNWVNRSGATPDLSEMPGAQFPIAFFESQIRV